MDDTYQTTRLIITATLLAMFVLNVNNALAHDHTARLSLYDAVAKATEHDPWLQGNVHTQRSLESLSRGVSLPSPEVSISQTNLPLESLKLHQDAMSQFKVGISQALPRGDSLNIKRHQLKTQSQQYPYWRQDRYAKITATVGALWLDLFVIEKTVGLITKNERLFKQLLEVAQSRYTSTIGTMRQNNIVRAELELARIEDKLIALNEQKHGVLGKLRQWLPEHATLDLTDTLPTIKPAMPDALADSTLTDDRLKRYFYQHPSVVALDTKIMTNKLGIDLARQKYKPQWRINAHYGHRNNRDDLLSLGITFDMPLFTKKSSDEHVKARIMQTEATKTEKQLRLQQLRGEFLGLKGRLKALKKRKILHNDTLLAKFEQQTDVALGAYTNDVGDFSEVVRARIAELNAQIDQLTLNVEEQKLHLALNYLFAKAE